MIKNYLIVGQNYAFPNKMSGFWLSICVLLYPSVFWAFEDK
jgi:hypothetical protein